MKSMTRRLVASALLSTVAGVAAAHPGHGQTDLTAGLLHPLGLDHLLAMVAVGLWSVAALRGAQRGLGPAVFLCAMGLGGWLGIGSTAGPAGAWLEQGMALSVLLMGVLVVQARRWPVAAGLGLIGALALLHGFAHGREMPPDGQSVGYVAGFLLTTAALHLLGLAWGAQMERARAWVWRLSGALFGLAGLVMLVRA